MAGQSIAGVNVIANSKDAPMYVCQQWIVEVLIVVPDDKPYPDELIKKLEETGVTMHLRLSKIAAVEDRPQFVVYWILQADLLDVCLQLSFSYL